VVEATYPILDILEKDPSNLEWIEGIASYVLQGCVNQPVWGMMEISAWTAVASADSQTEKLEAAKQLIAIETVKQVVATSDPKPGAAVEVEAGNSLMRAVHESLVATGMAKWPGVPAAVSYEGYVANWVQTNTDRALEEVAEANSETPEQTFDRILNIHDFPLRWARVVHPEKTSEIKQEYADKASALNELVSLGGMKYEADPDFPVSDVVMEQINAIEKQLKGTPKERVESLTQMNNGLEAERDTAITEMARRETLDGLAGDKNQCSGNIKDVDSQFSELRTARSKKSRAEKSRVEERGI
jgi:hypothetical protein